MKEDQVKYQLIFPTPYGEASVVYTIDPFKVKAVLLPSRRSPGFHEDYEPVKWGAPDIHKNALRLAESIISYFEGKKPRMKWPPWQWLDISGFTPLQQTVLKAVGEIPNGEVRSYGQIAESIGRPRASRFVGSVMAKNPYPILIPCHRVIRSNGSFGQFGGGADLKQKMIALEKRRL